MNSYDCYDLSYEWIIISGRTSIHQNIANPFLNMGDYDSTDLEGVICVNNPVTTSLISELIKNDVDFNGENGCGTISTYKKRILYSLSLFYD